MDMGAVRAELLEGDRCPAIAGHRLEAARDDHAGIGTGIPLEDGAEKGELAAAVDVVNSGA
jgi:hypothetical protein